MKELTKNWNLFCAEVVKSGNYLDSDFNFDSFMKWMNDRQYEEHFFKKYSIKSALHKLILRTSLSYKREPKSEFLHEYTIDHKGYLIHIGVKLAPNKDRQGYELEEYHVHTSCDGIFGYYTNTNIKGVKDTVERFAKEGKGYIDKYLEKTEGKSAKQILSDIKL
jgi:hypothetical protein